MIAKILNLQDVICRSHIYEHKKFDREILKQIKTLYVYDNWHAPIALLMDYVLIIFAIILTEYSYWLLPYFTVF